MGGAGGQISLPGKSLEAMPRVTEAWTQRFSSREMLRRFLFVVLWQPGYSLGQLVPQDAVLSLEVVDHLGQFGSEFKWRTNP